MITSTDASCCLKNSSQTAITPEIIIRVELILIPNYVEFTPDFKNVYSLVRSLKTKIKTILYPDPLESIVFI